MTFCVLTILAVTTIVTLVGATPAHAATFVVNSTNDREDNGPGDGVCFTGIVIPSPDGVGRARECALRAAIQEANNTAGPDKIHFNIGGSGVKTISPTSELPYITQAVTIDGYTQPGARVNTANGHTTNAILKIELDGTNAGEEVQGITIRGGPTTVRGLVINRFQSRFLGGSGGLGGGGIGVSGAPNSLIEGNFVGTNAAGTSDLGNEGAGVSIGAHQTVVRDNLISGNGQTGLAIRSDGGEARRNLIGIDKGGTVDLGNDFSGVAINGDNGTVTNNVVSSNDHSGLGDGVTVSGSGNRITNNTISLTATGDGVAVYAPGSANRILSNSIFSNYDLGIDLVEESASASGPTPNDADDSDTGANGLQNKPVLTSAVTSAGGTTTIRGVLDTKPNTTYTVQFFSNPAGGDEGQSYIGQKQVSTDTDGRVPFTFKPAKTVTVRKTTTATATASEGTSEFSEPRTVTRS